MTANAVAAAAAKVREKALDMASELLQTPASELEISEGVIFRKDAPSGPTITLGAVANALRPMAKTRGAREPGLSSDGWFNSEHQVYPYGNQFAVVKIDERTGAVKIERYLIAYDVGRAINPMLVRGQILGGFAQGLGGALLEEFLYDDRGEPLSVTFADYLMPTIAEVPPVEVLLAEDAPSPRNPLGIKGAGESGIAPVGAAIASAVEDALQMPGLVRQLPLSPQRIKAILEARQSA
jgi:carbon-monoxide dehydrogenase large subunit/6-hydroxypseudooxynicotine dehydrogenase subunit gamma